MGVFGVPALVASLLLASERRYSTVDLSRDADTLLGELRATGAYHRRCSPTVHFSFVPPPPADDDREAGTLFARSTAVGDDDGDGDVFARVRRDFPAVAARPLLVLLPGLDGVGVSAWRQWPDLARNFECWRLVVDPDGDRASFSDLVEHVVDLIDDVVAASDDDDDDEPRREILLSGESFGGLLAPSAARRLRARRARDPAAPDLTGLVLINPATSYDRTAWSVVAPALFSARRWPRLSENAPTAYSVLGGAALALAVPDRSQLEAMWKLVRETRVSSLDEAREQIDSLLEGLRVLERSLPAATLEHRMSRWMEVGADLLREDDVLSKLDVPTLVVAGAEDRMLPSADESRRLETVMPRCERVVVDGAGHFVLDDRVNLTDLLLSSNLLNQDDDHEEAPYDPILDWERPSAEVFEDAMERRVRPLRALTSPVFFSTDRHGNRKKGLGFVPANHDKPILVVANHQLFGLDLSLILSQLVEERDIWVRGLAHPIIFPDGRDDRAPETTAANGDRSNNNNNDNNNGLEDFRTFGAVMVTPRNFYRLMQTGQAGLLFPGGVREVWHGKGEANEIFWPDRTDFVRTAARFDATIVPLSAVGAADSVHVLADAGDLRALPFGIGERLVSASNDVTAARFDANDEDEIFTPPLFVPKGPVPERHYFVFGRPFDTTTVDPRDRDACARVYDEVKAELRRGLDDATRARQTDPYRSNGPTRWAVERLTGKQTPTFPIEELSR